MATRVQAATAVMAASMPCYAGDAGALKEQRYRARIEATLHSPRADLLLVRVALHVQLRRALQDATVQQQLLPYLVSDNDGKDDNKQQQQRSGGGDDGGGSDVASSEAMAQLRALTHDTKARAAFFTRVQQRLQQAVLNSEAQAQLKRAHGVLAAWERENAVLLRHPMFMTYVPARALLLESAATVALYRQYAHLAEEEYSSDSSDGEVPDTLRRMSASSSSSSSSPSSRAYFTLSRGEFAVDEHNKMYSQQVLQNKRVEYEELRTTVAQLRQGLLSSTALRRLQSFLTLRNAIYATYGIDRLIALAARRDRTLGEVHEGGCNEAALVAAGPQGDDTLAEYARSCRVAQYALPKMAEACYRNYLHLLATHDWDAMMRAGECDAATLRTRLRPLKDRDTFLYWFLSCATADSAQLGPNKLVGKTQTVLEDYKRFWYPQRSGFVPSLNSSNRSTFANKVAARYGLPHLLLLSPATYTYRENNDANTLRHGSFDLVIYDQTNEKVLLIVANSHDERRPRGAYLAAQEERYRLAAVVRAALTHDNAYHGFECSGVVAEYLFDPEQGAEENYYCVMAPLRITHKTPTVVHVPLHALRPFTACPPRYYVFGSNWGSSIISGSGNNTADSSSGSGGGGAAASTTARYLYPASFAHVELNEDAMALCAVVAPDDLVERAVLPRLLTREAWQQQQQQHDERRPSLSSTMTTSVAGAVTPRTARSTTTPRASARRGGGGSGSVTDAAAAYDVQLPSEDEDVLCPEVPADALEALRECVLRNAAKWPPPPFLRARTQQQQQQRSGGGNSSSSASASGDGAAAAAVVRTPLAVFDDLMRTRHGVDVMSGGAAGGGATPRAHASSSSSSSPSSVPYRA